MKTIRVVPQVSLTSVREDRRRYPRVTVAIQAELRPRGTDVPTRVETVDLSEGGFYVQLAFTLEVGAELDIVLWLGERRVRTKGVVVTRHPHLGNGVQFASLSSEDAAVLASFLDMKIRSTPEKRPLVQ